MVINGTKCENFIYKQVTNDPRISIFWLARSKFPNHSKVANSLTSESYYLSIRHECVPSAVAITDLPMKIVSWFENWAA